MKFVHCTIYVKNLEKSLTFYQEILDLKIAQRFTSPDGREFIFLHDKEGDTEVELIYDGKTTLRSSGLSLGFAVPDARAYMSKMAALGIEHSELISPNPKTHFFFINDPDGLQIQLFEEAK